MIRNWDFKNLGMDFSNCDVGNGVPSDIDMFYLAKNGFLVLGEIKNERGYFSDGQRNLLRMIIDNYSHGGMILYIEHNKYRQNGDEFVDVAECFVKEYYSNHSWKKPLLPTTVREFMSKQFKRDMDETIALRKWLAEYREQHKLEDALNDKREK